MFADLFASHDLMEALAPFVVATKLPLCPLLGASKAVRRMYLEVARETGLLRVVARMLPASQIEYTLHRHRFEPIETYVDDDGTVRTKTIAPRLPLAWTVEVTTPQMGTTIAAHGVPCCDLWKRTHCVQRCEGDFQGAMPYAVVKDWPTAMYFLDDDCSDPHDLGDLISDLGLGSSPARFATFFVAPLLALNKEFNAAAIRLRVHSEAAGLARLGVAIES